MPPIFKALAEISAWFLFIFAWVLVVIPLLMNAIAGTLAPAAGPPPVTMFLAFAIAVGSLTLSVVVMKLRKELE